MVVLTYMGVSYSYYMLNGNVHNYIVLATEEENEENALWELDNTLLQEIESWDNPH